MSQWGAVPPNKFLLSATPSAAAPYYGLRDGDRSSQMRPSNTLSDPRSIPTYTPTYRYASSPMYPQSHAVQNPHYPPDHNGVVLTPRQSSPFAPRGNAPPPQQKPTSSMASSFQTMQPTLSVPRQQTLPSGNSDRIVSISRVHNSYSEAFGSSSSPTGNKETITAKAPLVRQKSESDTVAGHDRTRTLYLSNSSVLSDGRLDSREAKFDHGSPVPRHRRKEVSEGGLNLQNMSLTAIPEQIQRMISIQELNLSSNKIQALPSRFGQMSQIRVLDMSNNCLTAFPVPVLTLRDLQSLNLGNNMISSLPTDLSQLQNLEELDVSMNRITEIPYLVPLPPNLKVLDLSGNAITMVPPSLKYISSLQELCLSENQISVLPDSISSLSNLEFVDVSNNKITTIPTGIHQLTRLTHFNISFNSVFCLPNEIGYMCDLHSFVFENNPIEYPPPSILGQELLAIKSFMKSSAELLESGSTDDSAYKMKVDAQDRQIRQLLISAYANEMVTTSRIMRLESLIRNETFRNDLISNQAQDTAKKLEIYEKAFGPDPRLDQLEFLVSQPADLQKQVETLREERDHLMSQIVEKERQYSEASQRKKELLSESIRKIEDLVRHVKSLEDENKRLVSERNHYRNLDAKSKETSK
eukprot:TRINITY_DN2654_c0_g1_i6.p1 TRINITY_DN2654_c0_g1~~TRINITY_DN2654_c0_g1_i6.p1  ORF type:complete len:639 (-),score=112.02 TRINITY_DN2654_c0_g1_i6:637-2553(-)